ncbi:MAG: disulfide bond formation protein B [Roseicyclus sp.]
MKPMGPMQNRRSLIALAAGGSAMLLLAAFAFQHLGGLAPCAMCLWQRWPHAAAVAIGAVGLALPSAVPAGLGALAMLGNAGIAFYHTGVERDWWEGPASCSGGGLGSASVADLLDPGIGGGFVMCDEVAWSMLGLSMASWNGLGCLALAALWGLAARRRSTD